MRLRGIEAMWAVRLIRKEASPGTKTYFVGAIPECILGGEIFGPYYQISVSWFLIDIDFVSKIFRISLDESLGLFGARCFKTMSTFLIFAF